MNYDCILIGGGASGLMFASKLHNVNNLLLEASPRLGSKLLMSGGGHCNITHGGSIKDFVDCYGDSGKRLRSCLYKHSNLELIDMLEKGGIATVTNDEGRVFPASMRAKDVLEFFEKRAYRNGWDIRLDSKVVSISPAPSKGYEIATSDGSTYQAKRLIIATGGITYPRTGSDGSLFKVLRDLGVSITKLHSVLAPLSIENYPYSELAGISLGDISIQTGTNKKNRHEYRGSMLFAHNDITGPAVLNISRYAAPGSEIIINYIPDFESPMETLQRELSSRRADYSTIIAEIFELPKRFAQVIVLRASSAKEKATASRDGISIKRIIQLLTSDRLIVESRGGNGMVTSGGVELGEISTKTMELKKHPGIYVIGEALDVDGITGGYNLQFAYSSASAAADAISSTSDFFSSRQASSLD